MQSRTSTDLFMNSYDVAWSHSFSTQPDNEWSLFHCCFWSSWLELFFSFAYVHALNRVLFILFLDNLKTKKKKNRRRRSWNMLQRHTGKSKIKTNRRETIIWFAFYMCHVLIYRFFFIQSFQLMCMCVIAVCLRVLDDSARTHARVHGVCA